MKVRDSGMPNAELWDAFFDERRILAKLDFSDATVDVVDFGCGYGTFAVVAATLTAGAVYALDIDPAMVEATAMRAERFGVANVKAIQRDFISEGTGLAADSVGYAMLFNILHAEDPVGLLREGFRVLRPGGRVAAIHWIYDAATPRGPDLRIRPQPEHCQAWMRQAGFELVIAHAALPPYHYGMLGRKPSID
jgi:SAM-dependent methyltransferase